MRTVGRIRRTLLSFVALSTFIAASMVAASPAGAVTNGTCQNVTVPVALAAGLPSNQTIAGTLCTPSTWAGGAHQVDVLIHGATYNRSYWNWPTGGGQYSYVDRTLAAGRATFAYDRIGVGASSRPLGLLVTLDADAHALHQIVGWLSNTRGYGEVNTVGHSLGSAVAIQEAGTYDDVDRVVLTGVLHGSDLTGLLGGAVSFYPAMLDPAFFGLLDPGYLTTLPGVRGAQFYGTTADPSVIAYDEAHKDKFAAVELPGAAIVLQGPAAISVSNAISASVLTVVGAQDALVCAGTAAACAGSAALTANEAPYYSSAASSDGIVVPNTGHNLTLHPSAGVSFTAIDNWITTH